MSSTRRVEVNPVGLAFIDDDGTFAPLEEATAELSDDGMTLSGEVEHFTTFVIQSDFLVTVEQTNPTSPVPVGESFTFELAVSAVNGVAASAEPTGLTALAIASSLDPSPLTATCESEGPLEIRGMAVIAAPVIGIFVPMTYRATCFEFPVLTELLLTPVPDGTATVTGEVSLGPAEGGGFTVSYPSALARFALTFDETTNSYFLACIDDSATGGMPRCELKDFRDGLQGEVPVQITELAGVTFMTVPSGVIDASAEEVVIVLDSMNLPVGRVVVDTIDEAGNPAAGETPLDRIHEFVFAE